jgi:hypothetical protein
MACPFEFRAPQSGHPRQTHSAPFNSRWRRPNSARGGDRLPRSSRYFGRTLGHNERKASKRLPLSVCWFVFSGSNIEIHGTPKAAGNQTEG